MRYDEAPLPHQLKDEDLWWIFKKPQLSRIGIVGVLVAALIKFMSFLGCALLGKIIGAVIAVITLVLVMIEVPQSMYLYGAGNPLYVPVIFFLQKKLRKKDKIYAKDL